MSLLCPVCPVCQDCLAKPDLYTSLIPEVQKRPHHLSSRSLKRSVDSGCYACNRLWAVLDPEERQLVSAFSDGQPESALVTNLPFEKVETCDIAIPLAVISISDGAQFGHPKCFLWEVAFDAGPVSTLSPSKPRPYWRLSFLLKPFHDTPAYLSADLHSESTKSPETIATAKGWINKCITSHELCPKTSPTDTQWYPTRLLDCGSSNDPGLQCRIIDTNISKLHETAESYPDDLPVNLRPSSISLKGFGIRNQSTFNNGLSVYLYWAEIVKAYTSCKLTFQQDKLVALSAIVKKVMKTLGDEYVAGMWRKYLDRELLWSVSVSTYRFDIEDRAHANFVATCDRTLVTYTAPSWSWVSTSGKVDPGLPDVPETDVMIAVEDYDLEYATPDTTCFIRGGWLRVWGELKTLKLIPYRSSPTCTTADWEMVVNGTNISVLSDSMAREPQPHVMLDTYHSDFDRQNSTSTLFCMPAREKKGDEGSLYVLLLELQDRDSGTFRHIGMARGWGKEVKHGILWDRDKATQLPCEAFINGRSLVRLV
ncbi:hypothetical protein CGCSCA4_v013615 [Colletotrichum siamense]|uniref:Heterokaryon incompatibility domain-containing protein n=1 Tax=Colletotrichum siamense TaxID=690259 RepID=A0A9P5EQK8_COLSI|nr:hypothetical protein CGCSCA4_v013615 [Colletotrichum siamense]KAF4857773.1 hypothetical protein CGCSCA2_v007831 [Colletotrichum siamense]